MRTLDAKNLIEPIKKAIISCQANIEPAALALIGKMAASETKELPAFCLAQILENAEIAGASGRPACQDSGLAVFFADIGEDVHIAGSLVGALNDAVRAAHREGFLRQSVADPLTRKNTGGNTPAVIHTEIVPGDKIRISYLAKGAGSENMSAVVMLPPSAGKKGIIDGVVDCVKRAGANPCPPILLGVGIGGTMEKAAILSKRALLRESGTPSPDAHTAALEAEILESVNALGIGAQGLGGGSTCFAVHVETFPTHIGMLPVAVTVQCHSVRHFSMEF